MVLRVSSHSLIRFALAWLALICVVHVIAPVAAAEPDRVSFRESTIAWRTLKYATTAENGFVAGSLDTTSIVERSFKTYVLENR